MATANYSANDAWQEVTQAGSAVTDDFILENQSAWNSIEARFDTATPATDATAHHIVGPNGTLIRAGVAGKLFIKRIGSGGTTVSVTGAS